MNLTKLHREFPGKRAIITGANSGVGYELMTLLLAEQWKVLAIDVQTDRLDRLKECHSELEVSQLDITQREGFGKTISGFCNKVDGLDIMFNNAGVGEGVRFKDYSLSHWDWIMDINLKSVVAGCHFAFEHMQKQSKGLIVNMASAAGYANLPNMSPYNVTKAGVIALSESLAHEFSPYGIRVLCVTPTFFKSNILQNSRGTADVLESAHRVVNGSKLTSRDAAQIILSKLHRKKEMLRFPLSASAIYYSKKFFKSPYTKLVRKYLVK